MKKKFYLIILTIGFIIIPTKSFAKEMTKSEISDAILKSSKKEVKITYIENSTPTDYSILGTQIKVDDKGGERTYVNLKDFCAKIGICNIKNKSVIFYRGIKYEKDKKIEGTKKYEITVNLNTSNNTVSGYTKIGGVKFSKDIKLQESQAVFIGDVPFVPIRFFAQASGSAVEWKNNKVIIYDSIFTLNNNTSFSIIDSIGSASEKVAATNLKTAGILSTEVKGSIGLYSLKGFNQYMIIGYDKNGGIKKYNKDTFSIVGNGKRTGTIYVVYKTGVCSFPGIMGLEIKIKD